MGHKPYKYKVGLLEHFYCVQIKSLDYILVTYFDISLSRGEKNHGKTIFQKWITKIKLCDGKNWWTKYQYSVESNGNKR